MTQATAEVHFDRRAEERTFLQPLFYVPIWFMTNHMEEPTDKPLIPFTPVPLRTRRDGWTVEKQIAFIEALAETGVVEHACRRVGMSRTSADELRRRPAGAHFRRAWEIAVDYACYRIEEDAHHRARHGVARPIFHKGEQVGEYRHYDERLTMFLLRYRRPHRYADIPKLAPTLVVAGPEDDEPDPDEAIGALDFHLDDLEDVEPLTPDGANFVKIVGDAGA